MKKSLSIALSLLMVISCISVLFTGMTVSAAAGENHTVSTSVEAQNGLYGGVITTNATQSVVYGDSATVTADPYYGNGFLGWYDGDTKVSDKLSYTFVVEGDIALKAKFDIRNLVENGNFETVSAQQATVNSYNNGPSYSAANKGTAGIIETSTLTNTDAKFGSYALKLTPAAGNNAAKQKSLLCVPVTVEKNTDYIWRFSYKVDETPSVAFSSNHHCLKFALNNKLTSWGVTSTVKYTIHSQVQSDTVDTSVWGWEGGTAFSGVASADNGRNSATKWQDVYILFNTGEDAELFANGDTGTMYLMLGNYANACVDDTYIDNMSVSKAAYNSISTVTATAGGTVTAQEYRCQEDYYVYTNAARGNASAYTGRDTSKVFYPTMYEKFTATADAGSKFLGWFDGDTLVSTAATAPLLMTGKTYTAKFASAASASAGGTIVENADGTYTAYAFYGNKFVGWYDSSLDGAVLVTTAATADTLNTAASYAKFTTDNQIYNGDFEAADEGTSSYWQNLPHYAPATPAPTYTVIDNPLNKQNGPEFGDKVLAITPTQSNSNDKLKNLLNYPVNVEAGKQYIWRFSYAFMSPAYDSNTQYLNFSIDKWQDKGTPEWAQGIVPVSYHSQTVNYVKDNANDLLDNISDAIWSWGKVTTTNFNTNKAASAANEWVDLYVIFTAPTTGKVFLSLGTVQSITDTIYFDNMSFTEVNNGAVKPVVTAGEHGSVSANVTATQAAFEAQGDRGIADPLNTSIDATKPLSANMYVDYYATADAGYLFDGWYNASNQKVSSDKKLQLHVNDAGTYTAKFIYDANRYYVSATLESANGAYGGYLEGETYFNELTSGSTVTLKAVAYDGNTFAGWYDGAELVSDKAELEYVVTKNTDLVAKFNRNNLMADSGYENTALSTTVMGAGKEWTSTASGAYGNVVNLQAATGIQGINIGAADAEVKHAAVAVEAGKIYHLAFDWMMSKAGADYGLEYVRVYSENDALLGETLFSGESKGTEQWMSATVNFESKTATKVYFVFKYKGFGSSIYIDNVVLYDTATAPFVIKTEMEMDNVYPGYIVSDPVQSVFHGNSVTITVKPYTANKFIGWYKDGEFVSDLENYTFTAREFATYTAKFEINNLIPDSGFENNTAGISLSEKSNWWVNEGNKALYGFDAFIGSSASVPFNGNDARPGVGVGSFEIRAQDGDQMLRATHRNNSFGTTLTGLKENTNYVFSFYWVTQSTYDTRLLENAYMEVVKLTGVQTKEELGAGRGSGIGTLAAPEYQKVTIPFFSGQNTEIALEIKYHAGSGDIFIDNMALYESDFITLVAGEGGKIETTFNGGVSGPAQRGELIELEAKADTGYEFIGWYDYTNSSKVFSTNANYSFNANGAVAIAAYFKPIGSNEDPINYFVDGDFENNCIIPPTFDHPNSSTDWCAYGITTQAGNTAPYSGDNCLQLTSHSRYANFLISNLEPFTTYTVSMAYYTPEYVNFGSVMVNERRREMERREEKNPDGVYQVNPARHFSVADRVSVQCLGYCAINDTDTADSWHTLEFTFTTVNRTEAYLMFNYSRPKGSNNLYLDDIQIKKTDSGYTDTVVNGDFESTNTEYGWQGNIEITTSGDNNVGKLADGNRAFNNLVLKRFTDYTVTFSARSADAATLHYGMTVGGRTLYNADGTENSVTSTTRGIAVLGNEWKQYSFDITTSDVLNYALQFIAEGGNVEIDNVSIEATTSLKMFDTTNFEPEEGLIIRDNTIQTVTTTHVDGSRDWQANLSLNKKFYELYTATAEGDAKVHSGVGSLIMKKSADNLTTDETNAYKATGAPLAQEFAMFRLQFGKTYEISYWVRAEEANTTFKSMLIETASNWALTEVVGETITADTEWKKITHKIISSENIQTGGGLVRLCLNRINSELKSDVYIDDIVVKQIASTVTVENNKNMYTQDISQNYLENYSFESTDGVLGAYSKADDNAVYGDKIGTFKAGDKEIIPVKTRTNYQQTFSEEYTLAASVRGNASAKGGIYVTIDAEGKEILRSFATDEIVTIAPNTNGAWKRSAFTFADERFTTLYLVIECTAGSFDVDYLEFFNADYGYETVQYDHELITFNPEDESNFVDPNEGQGNYITGTLTGLPEGSHVVLLPVDENGHQNDDEALFGEIDADGLYEIVDIPNGNYMMYVAAGDAEDMTLWGDLTIKDLVLSGLACERFNGNVIATSGMGVRNGLVKLTDNDTGWSYLTATNANGEYTAYTLEGDVYVVGTTKDPAAFEANGVTPDRFNKEGASR